MNAVPRSTARPPIPPTVVTGVAAVLFATLVLVGAHLAVPGRFAAPVGVVSLVILWCISTWTDRLLRSLPTAGALAVVAVAAVAAAFAGDPAVVYITVVLAALAWGGEPDIRPAALWATTVATAGAVGGVLFALSAPVSLTWAVILLAPVLAVGLTARAYGLPPAPWRRRTTTCATTCATPKCASASA